ncbi:MAG: hypothetical protein LBG15_14860 [Dysgonamonadaceae bacterium]|jgi:hypothetical protein|nr:hypothetical protein [Dysgonamonadaceae bacterium]
MPRRNRQTLKEHFQSGKRPSQQDFDNLIDSTVNILDDGFSKSAKDGMSLAPLIEKGTVLSVFKEISDAKPQWEFALNSEQGLEIRRCESDNYIPIMVLKTDGSIVLSEKGKDTVFAGTVGISVREGTLFKGEVPADGHWHDITDELAGNLLMEVVAVAGGGAPDKQAVMVATAISCSGIHPKIRKTQSYCGIFGHKIRLRWKKIKGEHKTKLQLKTVFKYRNNAYIQYHITSLWNDNP